MGRKKSNESHCAPDEQADTHQCAWLDERELAQRHRSLQAQSRAAQRLQQADKVPVTADDIHKVQE